MYLFCFSLVLIHHFKNFLVSEILINFLITTLSCSYWMYVRNMVEVISYLGTHLVLRMHLPWFVSYGLDDLFSTKVSYDFIVWESSIHPPFVVSPLVDLTFLLGHYASSIHLLSLLLNSYSWNDGSPSLKWYLCKREIIYTRHWFYRNYLV